MNGSLGDWVISSFEHAFIFTPGLRFLPSLLLLACAQPAPRPTAVLNTGFDPETQALIAGAERVAFIIPFSHWDTDWHDTFANYVQRSDRNILQAIRMAQASPRFRYTLEQVYFVPHFWETYPEHRAALEALVQARQITFAWAGMTQPETSLVAPAIQVRNWQMGREWIAQTFGAEYVPHTAWQSDAFGNSAALPIFLSQMGVPYLFIGRWQHRCDPDYGDCTPLPHAFRWKSPAAEASVVTAYISYPDAWGALFRAGDDEAEQLKALRAYIDEQLARTESKFVFIPLGFDFLDPAPNLVSLVGQWNAGDRRLVLVLADPQTAFQHLATQDLPEFEVDMNPIWQAFYGSRPFAKIADKETEYFLTAADKFGLIANTPRSSAWLTATISAHYDNIAGVSFDPVWESSQRPRYEQTLAVAANDLAATLAQIASGVDAPLLVFNPTSWPRSEAIAIADERLVAGLPHQLLSGGGAAFRLEAIPSVGYAALAMGDLGQRVTVLQSADSLTLSNGLVSVTLEAAHGGAFSNLRADDGAELLEGFGDEATYWADTGDVYGARFGAVQARMSQAPAQLTVLEAGPLLARAQAALTLGGQPLTKTVTLRADSPLIEIALEIKALPETTAVAHTSTRLDTRTRTDDLGFAAMTHAFNPRPIQPGDVTYRRHIFYPTLYWTDIADATGGLALITHGLQGIGGVDEVSLLLVRHVAEDEEGLTDPDYHTLRYAYYPYAGSPAELWRLAYSFNQPLIPVWRADSSIAVQLPFEEQVRTIAAPSSAAVQPPAFSLLTAEGGLVADVYREGDQTLALILDYSPATPVTLTIGASQSSVDGLAPMRVPIDLPER